MDSSIDMILVPRGAEFKAVQRGLRRSAASHVVLHAIPMGPQAVQHYLTEPNVLAQLTELTQRDIPPCFLLMGLCGSLVPGLNVGDWVLYRSCFDGRRSTPVPPLNCDTALLHALQKQLGKAVTTVPAVMMNQVVHQATEKQALAVQYGAEVVDMEGYTLLEMLKATGAAVGMLRTVSDDAQHDLPDLSAAMTATGTLDPWAMTTRMLRQPGPAWRLIQGSLKGLQRLEDLTVRLFQTGPLKSS
jgi:hypothetical protein